MKLPEFQAAEIKIKTTTLSAYRMVLEAQLLPLFLINGITATLLI
jgi:hypothetical protein